MKYGYGRLGLSEKTRELAATRDPELFSGRFPIRELRVRADILLESED